MPLLLGILSGICFGTGVVYLFTGLRRPGDDRLHILFGLFALAYAGAIVTGLLAYKAPSLDAYMRISRWGGIFTVLTLISLLGFASVYTKVRPWIFLAVLSMVLIVVGVAAIVRPNFIHTDIYGISLVTLPWGETIALLDATESIWEIVFFLSELTVVGYLIYACVRQFLHGERQAALALGLGLLFLMFALVFDILFIDSGALSFVYLGDYGFIPLLIVMGLQLANQVIRTEEQLAQFRADLEMTLAERTTDLEVLNQITETITSTVDLQEVLTRVCETVNTRYQARMTHVVYLAESGDVTILNGFDRQSGLVQVEKLEIGPGTALLVRQIFPEGQPLATSDLSFVSTVPEIYQFLMDMKITYLLLAPLLVRGEIIGLLSVSRDQSTPFTPQEVSLAETVAGYIAGAIENSRLVKHSREAAADEERHRLAHDLHDAVTQTIYSASLIAEVLPQIWARSPEEGQRNLVKLRALVRGALAEMRTLLFALRPAALETADLATLLRQLGDALTGRTRIPVQVTVEIRQKLPVAVKVTLYRIAQEAVNNIAKHSEATRAWIDLQSGEDHVILRIGDNGRGFDPEHPISSGHMGMHIMRERAEKIGASLEIDSSPDHGARLAVTWKAETEEASS